MTRVVRESHPGLLALAALLPAKVEAMQVARAETLRVHLAEGLDRGDLPIRSDTEALAEGLYVQTPAGSDYNERVAAAEQAYLGNTSRHMDRVREKVPEAYTPAHFAERVVPEQELPQLPGEVSAAVAVIMAYGFLWEFGHANIITKQEEHRPWMTPITRMYFAELLSANAVGLWS